MDVGIEIKGDPPGPVSPLNTNIAVAPRIRAIFPEYMTDPSILICPSDPSDTIDGLKNAAGDWNFFNLNGTVGGALDDADDSYGYFGYAFDRCDDNDPSATVGSFPGLNSLFPAAAAVVGPGQWLATIDGVLTRLVVGNDFASADKDVTVPAPLGNAGGTTVTRLKEGIERFMITDINNPAASALAQSTLYIMFDALSTDVKNYNHIPGGSNVLFMDGHVEFMKYPGKAPVGKNLAAAVGGLFD